MMATEEESLLTSASRFETSAKLCGGLVVLGILLEALLALYFSDQKDTLRNFGPVFADLLVAGGVWGELHFGGKRSKSEERLREISNEKVAAANARAAEAMERTAELQKLTAWRHIDPERYRALRDSLHAHVPGIKLAVEYETGDPEAYAYARELALTFRDAGIVALRFQSNSFLVQSTFGLNIAFSFGANFDPIVRALSEAKIDITGVVHINPEIEAVTRWGNDPPNMQIFVGPKPPPPFTGIDNINNETLQEEG